MYFVVSRDAQGRAAGHWVTHNAGKAERQYNSAAKAHPDMLVMLFKVPEFPHHAPHKGRHDVKFEPAMGWLVNSEGKIPDMTVLLLRSLEPARTPTFPYERGTGWMMSTHTVKPMLHIWDTWNQLLREKDERKAHGGEPAPKRRKQSSPVSHAIASSVKARTDRKKTVIISM